MSETRPPSNCSCRSAAGEVRPNDFRLEEAAMPNPGPGAMLLNVRYLSLDPYIARPHRRSEVLCRSGRIEVALLILKVKSDLPPRDRRERLHFLHLAGKAVDILDENLNDGGRAVVTALQFLDAGGNVLV